MTALHIPFYDPSAHPPEWQKRMKATQFAVMPVDPQMDIALDESGNPADCSSAVAVLDSLEDARAYAAALVERSDLSCAVIRRQGEVVERIYRSTLQRRFDPLRIARRDAWIAAGFLPAGLGVLIYAALQDWQPIWAYIAGPKCLLLAAIFGVRSYSFFAARKVEQSFPPTGSSPY